MYDPDPDRHRGGSKIRRYDTEARRPLLRPLPVLLDVCQLSHHDASRRERPTQRIGIGIGGTIFGIGRRVVQRIRDAGLDNRTLTATRHRPHRAMRGRVARGAPSVRPMVSNHRRIDDEIQPELSSTSHVDGDRRL